MHIKISKLLFVNILLLFNLVCFAQLNNFKQWSIKNGLAQSDVWCVKQDNRGYLWIGTGDGVNVFDGKNFKTYSKKDGLAGNVIMSILVDRKGRVWIGSEGGITIYDGVNFKTLTNKDGIEGAKILCFLENKDGVIWAGTDDGGINLISETSDNKFKIELLNENDGLSPKSVFELIEGKNNTVWAATFGGGINIIKTENKKYGITKINTKSKIPSDNILCVANNGDGNLWFGTYDAGAFKLNENEVLNGKINPIPFNTSNGLNSNVIWDILVAKDKNVWFASNGKGINRLISQNNFQNSSYTLEDGLCGNQILSLFEDRDNHIWIGTMGDGLCTLAGDYFSHYTIKEGLPNNKIHAIAQDVNSSYWLATSDGGLVNMTFKNNKALFKVFNEKNGLNSNNISTVTVGNKFNNNLWIGTNDKGIIKYDGKKFKNFTEKDGLIKNRVYCILIDSKGIVWCGTSNGISKYDGTNFLNFSTSNMVMQDEGVNAIIEDKKGNIWFATAGGLARYGGGENLKTFDEVEGLKTKDVNALAEDKNGNIWIGTNGGGLYKFDITKNDTIAIEFVTNEEFLSSASIRSLIFENESTIIAGTYKGFDKLSIDGSGKIRSARNYNSSDGFVGLECNDNALFKSNDGNIWFGTVKGLTRYSPALERKTNLPPTLHITGLQLFFKDVDWSAKAKEITRWNYLPKELTLNYDENHLTFNFSALSFTNPEKIKYKYILEGRDKEWSPAKSNSEVTFSGLVAGKYVFKVMAENEEEVWSKPQNFIFEITPPWYKTMWFYISVVVIMIFSLFTYVKMRERTLVKEKEILEKIVEERTQEVRKQKEHLAEKNQEITDSINYAKNIQNSMLPPMNEIKHAWKDLFIFFQPKDIVSGDFYWFHPINENEFLIACADCTGHGVPGGFMSMVCADKLTEAAKESVEPAEILYKTNNAVKLSLRQQIESEGKSKDGMEVCLLKVNTKTRQVSYAGANRILWIVSGQPAVLAEVKPTKASIASFTEFNFNYQQHEFILNEGDLLYTTSDGYPDQFGGADGNKYMSKKMKTFILETCHLPFNDQHQVFSENINKWMGEHEQVDDILMIGIKL